QRDSSEGFFSPPMMPVVNSLISAILSPPPEPPSVLQTDTSHFEWANICHCKVSGTAIWLKESESFRDRKLQRERAQDTDNENGVQRDRPREEFAKVIYEPPPL
uniref:Uncharacterized protein n=1 Tax=Amphilophus citrinellus TaxID=61819 RepID=A0A3Q0STJ1_AMPCI